MPWKKANKELCDLLDGYMKAYRCDRRMMFGAPTFFINNNMFAGVHEDTVILRLSEEDRNEIFAKKKEVRPFTPMGAHVMKEYVALPEIICRDAALFKSWLDRAYKNAYSLPPKAPKRSGANKS